MMTVIRQFNEDHQPLLQKKRRTNIDLHHNLKLISLTIAMQCNAMQYIVCNWQMLPLQCIDWGHSTILIKLKNISSTNISLQKLRDKSWTRQAQEKVTLAFAQVGTGEVFPTFPHMSSSPRLPFPFHHQPPCLLPKLPNSLQPPWKAPSRHH